MEEKEILLRLEQQAKRQTNLARVQCVCSVLSLVCMAAVLVVVLSVVPQINGILSGAEAALAALTEVTEQLKGLDISSLNQGMNSLLGDVNGLIQNADTILGSSGTSLQEIMDRVNAIDFEGLNKAITDLSDVIEPLANFFNRFK